MGSIYKRKNSPYWWMKWRDHSTGKIRRESTLIKNVKSKKRDAEKKLEERVLESKMYKENPDFNYKKSKRLKLSEGFKLFLDYKQKRKNEKLAEKTVISYKSSVSHFILAVKDRPIYQYCDEDCADFEEYMDLHNLSRNTQGIHTRQLKAIFNWFIAKEYIRKNPIYVIRPRKTNPLPIPYEHMKLIFELLSQPRYYHLLILNILLLMTGLRSNELLNVRKKDINFAESFYIVQNKKGKKDNVIKPLPEELKLILRLLGVEKMNDDEYILRTHYKNYYGYESAWRRAMAEFEAVHKAKYQMKQFRKNFSSFLIDSGLDIYDVHQVVGHSDIKTLVEHYLARNRNKIKKEIDTKVKFIGNLLDISMIKSLR